MADQADFPDIYIDSSVESGGVGSEADPYSAFSEINWTTGGDNSIFDYYAGAPSASVTINLKKGEVFNENFSTGCSGTLLCPILIQGYGVGDNPVIDGAIDISTASYKWTATANWTSSYKEYGLEDAGGGDPGVDEPKQVFIDGVRCSTYNVSLGVSQEIGTLLDHGYVWGDPGAGFGFPTIVIRDETGDPDTEDTLVEMSDGSRNYMVYLNHQYIIFDGVDVMRSNGHGFRFVGSGSANSKVKNLIVSYNFWAGVQLYGGANDCEINNVEAYGSLGANFNMNGSYAARVERLLITGCSSHDCEVEYLAYDEGSGLKAFGLLDCTITKSVWYDNPSGGIRFDGTTSPEIYGCIGCSISENEFYGNGGVSGILYAQLELEYSAENLIFFNYFHDPWGGGPNLVFSHSGTDDNFVYANILAGSYTNHWQGSLTFQTGSGAGGANHAYNNLIYGAYKGIIHSSTGYSELKNNIVAASLSVDIVFPTAALVANMTSNYNCLTGEGTNKTVRVLYTNYSLPGWVTLSGQDANSISDDPLLTDPGSEDFSLQTGSPCRDVADSTLGSPYNIGLRPGSTWPDSVTTSDRDD